MTLVWATISPITKSESNKNKNKQMGYHQIKKLLSTGKKNIKRRGTAKAWGEMSETTCLTRGKYSHLLGMQASGNKETNILMKR